MPASMLILIRGSGDIASAAAHCLFSAGYSVVLHDSPRPTSTRRRMAFTDAIFDGIASLDGVEARLLDPAPTSLTEMRLRLSFIPVLTGEFEALILSLCPDVLVDARMRKHSIPEDQRHLAPLTIGLGPNFTAGGNIHLAVETAWGQHLGQVVTHGATSPLTGEPRAIDGHARDRYLYAPCAGIFQTSLEIGMRVAKGQNVARVGEIWLQAPISGVLRGLTHDSVPVQQGAKVVEIDPRQEDPQVTGISERPARIAAGVLQAMRQWTGAE